jgi:hypothetical protein
MSHLQFAFRNPLHEVRNFYFSGLHPQSRPLSVWVAFEAVSGEFRIQLLQSRQE